MAENNSAFEQDFMRMTEYSPEDCLKVFSLEFYQAPEGELYCCVVSNIPDLWADENAARTFTKLTEDTLAEYMNVLVDRYREKFEVY